MMIHNQIVLSLNDEKLHLLLSHYFGEKGRWSSFHWVIDKEIEEWTESEKRELSHYLMYVDESYGIPKEDIKFEDYNFCKRIKKTFWYAREYINKIGTNESLYIYKTFEYPLIKGNGQYKCTKGFIDLIVECHPKQFGSFSTFGIGPIQFIIEIKKEKDFDDFGDILRQIKEYREYYEDRTNIKNWHSPNLMPPSKRIYGVLSTRIPNMVKELFKNENIVCIETEA